MENLCCAALMGSSNRWVKSKGFVWRTIRDQIEIKQQNRTSTANTSQFMLGFEKISLTNNNLMSTHQYFPKFSTKCFFNYYFCQSNSINITVVNQKNKIRLIVIKPTILTSLAGSRVRRWGWLCVPEDRDNTRCAAERWCSSSLTLTRPAFPIWGHHHSHTVWLFIWLLGD